MKTEKKTLAAIILSCSFITFVSPSAACEEEASASADQKPEKFLEFTSVNDGRCQILSTRGKLRTVKNTHPTQAIKYRLNRKFSGKPQAGLVVGKIEPNSEPVKLGCTKVDGRDQTWEVSSAKFVKSIGIE